MEKEGGEQCRSDDSCLSLVESYEAQVGLIAGLNPVQSLQYYWPIQFLLLDSPVTMDDRRIDWFDLSVRYGIGYGQ